MLLRKGVYPYEYMGSCERFNETLLPPKESFYGKLNLEDISTKDYSHAQKVWGEFGIINLGEYHDLYAQTDTLLLGDVYEKCRDKCIEIYGLDPCHFLSAPGLPWQACLKKTKLKLELLTDVNMLLMIEDGMYEDGIISSIEVECISQYIGTLKQIINTWKIMIKALSHHI